MENKLKKIRRKKMKKKFENKFWNKNLKKILKKKFDFFFFLVFFPPFFQRPVFGESGLLKFAGLPDRTVMSGRALLERLEGKNGEASFF